MPPAVVHLLYVNKIIIDDLRCRFTYCVHPLYPKHLIIRFERFRDTFFFGKLFYQPTKKIFRLLVNICKITV